MQKLFTWVMTLSILASPAITQASSQVQGASVAPEQTELRNVELNADGNLTGQLLSTDGSAISNARLQVHSQNNLNQVSQDAVTDEHGNFNVAGLRSGTCVISVGEESFACRVWQNGTAPPKSLESIAIVDSTSVVRGNSCGDCGQCSECQGTGNRFMNKIRCMTKAQKVGLGLVVAAAIAIPIALSNDKDNAS